jgi:glutaredoxin 3
MFYIYSLSACSYCVKAKELLDEAGIAYIEVHLDNDDEGRQFLRDQGHHTVPQIWDEGVHIGGYDDLLEALNG